MGGAVWKKITCNTSFFSLFSPKYLRFGPKNTYKMSRKFPTYYVRQVVLQVGTKHLLCLTNGALSRIKKHL